MPALCFFRESAKRNFHNQRKSKGLKRKWSRFVCLFSLFIAFSNNAVALERRDVSGEMQWTSAALQGAAGMGAFSESWVDQAQTDVSLLARRRGSFEMEFISPTLVVSRDASNSILDTVKTFSESNGTSNSTSSAQSTANALDKVRGVFGKSMTAQFNGAVIAPRIGRVGIAPYLSAGLDASIDNAAWPKLDTFGGGYAGVLMSYAQVIKKDFDLGVALRPGVGGYRSYDLDLSLFGEFITGRGDNSAQDPAKMLEFPTAFYCPLDIAAAWWMSPSTRFHLTSKNTFDALPLSSVSGLAGPIQNRLNVGFSQDVSLSGSKNQSLLVGGEIQDLAGMKRGWNELLLRTQWAARYAVKLPFRDQSTFALNVGLHSGFPVVSIFLDLFITKFEFALSARENGGYPGQRPNRLQTLSLRSQMQF